MKKIFDFSFFFFGLWIEDIYVSLNGNWQYDAFFYVANQK